MCNSIVVVMVVTIVSAIYAFSLVYLLATYINYRASGRPGSVLTHKLSFCRPSSVVRRFVVLSFKFHHLLIY